MGFGQETLAKAFRHGNLPLTCSQPVRNLAWGTRPRPWAQGENEAHETTTGESLGTKSRYDSTEHVVTSQRQRNSEKWKVLAGNQNLDALCYRNSSPHKI